MKIQLSPAMRVAAVFAFALAFSLSFANCGGKLVKKPELEKLNQKYSGEYILKQDTDIGNRETMKAGEKVKLYLQSGKGNIKVYAYPSDQPREAALGKNILLLFKDDFENEKYTADELDRKITELVKKAS